jgi:ArsR family transcriptional regulator
MSAPTNTIAVLKALADKTRLDIVRTLVKDRDDTASCAEVSTCSNLSQPAMSHHFKKLVDAGVLRESKQGTEKIYELNTPLLQKMGIDTKKL